MRPRLLDLFCGAGGAGMGYHCAGFEVVGVDITAQPNYPFEFIEADALEFMRCLLDMNRYYGEHGKVWNGDGTGPSWRLRDFDAIHASPPCPAYSKLAAMHPERVWPKLIAPVRDLLEQADLPWVIENVEGAPLALQPTLDGAYGVVLCGSMFGLGVERGYLRRHRLFEASFSIGQPSCSHKGMAVGVYGHGGHTGKHRMLYREEAAQALGVDWMTRDEMTQAIPPAYTEHIGRYLMAAITTEKAA